MQSYSNLHTYASQKTKDSYKNYVTLNYDDHPTNKPIFNIGLNRSEMSQ